MGSPYSMVQHLKYCLYIVYIIYCLYIVSQRFRLTEPGLAFLRIAEYDNVLLHVNHLNIYDLEVKLSCVQLHY